MRSNYILNEQGQPELCEDILTWGKWFEDADRTIKQTTILGDLMVSTVFLGIDHNYHGGEPLLWETLSFNHSENYICRYQSKEDSQRGHDLIARAVKNDLRKLRTWRRAKRKLTAISNKDGRRYFPAKV